MRDPDPRQRFSDRVDDYRRHRPGYPTEILSLLSAILQRPAPWDVADVGSGTGIFSRLLLEAGHRVWAVEPNEAMRQSAEGELASHRNFHSIAAGAEDTRLEASSIDLVTAAQAFHWFHVDGARREFQRILRPSGVVALIWNSRTLTTPFSRAYEALITRFGTDYAEVGQRHRVSETHFPAFFGPGGWEHHTLTNAQHLTREGLHGRLLSSSYLPNEGAARDQLLAAADEMFDAHAQNGRVTMEYGTEMFAGHLT